jgi:hypothetical protein
MDKKTQLSRMEAIQTILAPLRGLSLSTLNSGVMTPRMSLSRESSAVSAISLYTQLDQELKKNALLTDSCASIGVNYLPNEIIWFVLSQVAQQCLRSGKMADLLKCNLVDKRFNEFSKVFLYRNVHLTSINGFNSLLIAITRKKYGKLIRRVSLYNISYLEGLQWFEFLTMCPNLTEINVERCLIDASFPTSIVTEFPGVSKLIISDCATCPLHPILELCKRTTGLERLAITGCNFNEENMCDLISHCPRLKEIKLGSHIGASLTTVGSAGGDLFAKTLASKCTELISADLTGIISMTDIGWQCLMKSCGYKLEKLVIRRAMQISLDQFILISSCKILTRLTIANVPHITDEVVVEIMENIGGNLVFLQLESLSITDNSIEAVVKNCSKLVQLRLYQCEQLMSLNFIFEMCELKTLRYLILHGCRHLEAEEAYINEELSPTLANSATLAPISRIKYLSSVSPMILEPTSPAYIPANSPERENLIGNGYFLKHLEIVDCPLIYNNTLQFLLRHCQELKRFIFVGDCLENSIRKRLESNTRIKHSVYVLTPTTPNFE